MPGIELGSAACKARALLAVLLLQLPIFIFGRVFGSQPAILRVYIWLCSKGSFLARLRIKLGSVVCARQVPSLLYYHTAPTPPKNTVDLSPEKSLLLNKEQP